MPPFLRRSRWKLLLLCNK